MGSKIKSILHGNKAYIIWFSLLLGLSLTGLFAYARQLAFGLVTTGMGDEVSWGLYIANFAFLVGMAAAAVMLVIPAYIFKDKEIHKIVIFAELFAISALIMCLLFITVDLGRPDRLWHLVPGLGIFNWPDSMLTWDVLVLNGYLVLNLFAAFYLLYKKRRGETPKPALYLPIVFLSIAWAPSIHTVTAFLFQGLGARPFWHSGLIAPRFLASAFAAGPAFMILVFKLLESNGALNISEQAIRRIRLIVTVSLLINLLLIVSEVFSELYLQTEHSIHLAFLLGLKGKSILAPWIRASLLFMAASAVIFLSPLHKRNQLLIAACIMTVVGIWIEKGLGFVLPGFIPSPLGDFVQYRPSLNELFIVIGIWSAGLLIYTILVKTALPIIREEDK